MQVVPNQSISGQYWQWRQQPIYYVKAGEASSEHPPLLLVHGFGASTDHWRKNIQGLSQHFEVWAIDLLGFGRSGKPAWNYSGDLWRDQLHQFVTQVIRRPALLAGNSLGGYAALCVAAQRSEAVAGLILVNSAGPFTNRETTPVRPDPVRQVMGSVTQALFRQDWASYLLFQYVRQKSVIRKTLERVYLDKRAVTDALVEDIYRPSCDPGAAKVFASVFRTPQGERVDVLLEQVECPLLTVWGQADPWMDAQERGARFRHYYPALTEHYLEAGHCPHDEVPDQVNALITAWIKEKM
ncbi:MAG: alpha/beta fold hydrolase [Leptolyngbyaceae cyanobacterium]